MNSSTTNILSLVFFLIAVPSIIYYYNNYRNNGYDIPLNFDVTEGSFKILSYNVAGLPNIISQSNPKVNTKLISPKLNEYDLVNVQENFAYNRDLNSKLNFKYKTKFSGNVPIGDGLTTFSKYPLYMFDRNPWEDLHGFIVDGADAMTPKGFTFTSMEITPGFFIDVYNIHTDADRDELSVDARNSNMAQLAEYIQGISAGKAVLIFGDTNSKYTNEFDNFYDLIMKPCNLKDAWIETVMEGKIPDKGKSLSPEELGQKGEVLDKIWYRSGKNVEIEATSFEILFNEFTDEKGKQLSDHYPVTSTINFKLNAKILTTDIFGGINGKGFSFIEKMDDKLPISVTIYTTNTEVTKVGFTYADNGLVDAGENRGKENTYIFQKDEYITQMTISKYRKTLLSPYFISYISLTTNLNNVISGGDLKIFDQITFKAPEGYSISGFIGYSSNVINKLGCVYLKK